MSKAIIKNILFSIIMAILLFPLCFQPFDGTITEKLKGYQAPPKKVDLSFYTWLDASWQKYLEDYSKDQLQARHFLIRINNQLKYSLFDKMNANAVERGKNDFFFEYRYIDSYLGLNFRGEDFISKKVEQLQELTDTLNNHGVELLFVLASGKGHFMPENLPEKYQSIEKRQNHYETYVRYLKKSTVSYLDLNQYLLDMKDTTSYPLYTKGNIHWSFYAISFVTDTLIHTIENQLNEDLPDYSCAPVEIKYEPTFYTEGGIFKSLNLYWTELKDTFAYRNAIIEEEANKDKFRPKIWAVGDSFYGTLNTYKVPHQFFDPGSLFFYYNSQVSRIEDKNYKDGTIRSFLEKIEEQDMIIFFTTDAGIQDCSWGAAEEILKWYKEKK